jgi:molybdopterin-guanine dinucleotide biosynthesis protein A
MVPHTIGLILAGGQARRMGGVDKAFIELGGKPLLEHAIARARPQVSDLLISANGDPSRFARFGFPVLADRVQGFLGPLAGILTGLEWMRANRPDARWLASFACDCPFFPTNMVERLVKMAIERRIWITMAASAGRHHPVFAVWSAEISDSAESVLVQGGYRKMDDWTAAFTHRRLIFRARPFDPFFNINTPDDVAKAETLLAAEPAIR